MRRHVVRLITFVGGLYFLLDFLLPAKAPPWLGGFKNPLTEHRGAVTSFVIVVGTMAFLLGPLNLVRSHVTRIFRGHRGWLESIVFLVFLLAAILASALRTPEGAAQTARWERFFNVLHEALIHGITTAFFASSMALLAFYLVSAAHRAFRMSNVESGLMMGAAVIVLLGQVPLGDWMTHALPEPFQLRSAAQWILLVPNAGVQRAVLIGACGGAIAAGLRHWLGLGRRSE